LLRSAACAARTIGAGPCHVWYNVHAGPKLPEKRRPPFVHDRPRPAVLTPHLPTGLCRFPILAAVPHAPELPQIPLDTIRPRCYDDSFPHRGRNGGRKSWRPRALTHTVVVGVSIQPLFI